MGLTKDEIGMALGLCRRSFWYRKKADPKIEQMIIEGRASFKVFIGNTLVNQAKNGNVTAAIWLDKTRCGTRETQDLNINTAAIVPTKIVYEDQ